MLWGLQEEVFLCRWDERMDAPAGAEPESIGIGQWKEGITFGEFTELTVKKYHSQAAS